MSTTSKPEKKKALPVLTEGAKDKTMLPEVLPDPRRPHGASSPRGRTIAHMQRLLGVDSVRGMRRIVEHVRRDETGAGDAALVAEVSEVLRATEAHVRERAVDLASTLQRSIGRGAPLTDMGDRVATPLQRARETSVPADARAAS